MRSRMQRSATNILCDLHAHDASGAAAGRRMEATRAEGPDALLIRKRIGTLAVRREEHAIRSLLGRRCGIGWPRS